MSKEAAECSGNNEKYLAKKKRYINAIIIDIIVMLMIVGSFIALYLA